MANERLQAENHMLRERFEILVAAINRLLPYIHEDNMKGESSYELAVLHLEEVLKTLGHK